MIYQFVNWDVDLESVSCHKRGNHSVLKILKGWSKTCETLSTKNNMDTMIYNNPDWRSFFQLWILTQEMLKPGFGGLKLFRNSSAWTRPFWMLRDVPSWSLKIKPSRICLDSWGHRSSRRWCDALMLFECHNTLSLCLLKALLIMFLFLKPSSLCN